MSDEIEIIDLSDEESNNAPPSKRPKIENGSIKIENDENGSVKIENGSNSSDENGGSPSVVHKKTARKKMSSFTPKLEPTETITLDEEREEKPNVSQHPQYEEISSKVKQFLHEILGYVNSVEHATIKKKLTKRLTWVEQLPTKIKLHGFIEKLASLVEKVIRKPNSVFEITKDLLDEFERYKPGAVVAIPASAATKTEASNEDKYKYQKRKAHLKRLNKALRQCNREIRRLEEAECDWDDEEDSSYVRLGKYKSRFITIQKKINNLEGMKTSFGRACDKKFKTEASRIPEVNNRIQDLVNKERRFPDYHDIIKIYQSVVEDKGLDYSKQELSYKAKETFVQVGRHLKDRRYRDDMAVIDSYIPDDKNEEEPPEKDSSELRSILEQNDKAAEERINKLVNEFVDKQEKLKEEPKEVKDDEPESSKEEDDEEEEDEEEENQDELGDLDQNEKSDHDAEPDEKSDHDAEQEEKSDHDAEQEEKGDLEEEQNGASSSHENTSEEELICL